MKKIIIALGIIFVPFVSFASYGTVAVDVSGGTTVVFSQNSGPSRICLWDASNLATGNALAVGNLLPYTYNSYNNGTQLIAFAVNSPGTECYGYDHSLSGSVESNVYGYAGAWHTTPYVPPPADLFSVISHASSTFSSSVGITPAQTGNFMWQRLAQPILGSGLGLFRLLLPYIIALIIISCIVYFLFKGFRFMRH